MTVSLTGVYLDRLGRRIGILSDRGAGQFWRWVTTTGYYVRSDGRAAFGGPCSQDLVTEVTP